MIKKYLASLINKSYSNNKINILSLLEKDPSAKFLDLGCDTGEWSEKLAKGLGTKDVYGIDTIEERLEIANKKGIKIFESDLNKDLPFDSNFFDVIHANQVIEHLHSTDTFVSEIYRVLKKGGYAIISTENLSSWHNVFSLVFGLQPFSMANFSIKGTIGNPFSLWNDKTALNSEIISWQHMRLFSYFGLIDLFKKYNFFVENVMTTGYYPSIIDFSTIDKVHGHWITVKVRK